MFMMVVWIILAVSLALIGFFFGWKCKVLNGQIRMRNFGADVGIDTSFSGLIKAYLKLIGLGLVSGVFFIGALSSAAMFIKALDAMDNSKSIETTTTNQTIKNKIKSSRKNLTNTDNPNSNIKKQDESKSDTHND
jgi:uncharacterized membrane protein YqhA